MNVLKPIPKWIRSPRQTFQVGEHHFPIPVFLRLLLLLRRLSLPLIDRQPECCTQNRLRLNQPASFDQERSDANPIVDRPRLTLPIVQHSLFLGSGQQPFVRTLTECGGDSIVEHSTTDDERLAVVG